jgi:PAS domain S-box-containing protein
MMRAASPKHAASAKSCILQTIARSAVSTTPTFPLLQQVLAQVDDVVLITDADPSLRPGPRIVFVNAAFERMTGYSATEVIGQTPRVLQGERTNTAILYQLHTALKAWKSTRVRLTNYRKNGVPFDVEFDITPIANETGWYTHWVSIQRDITHSNVAASVIAESQSLEELRAGVCAELREYTGAWAVAWCTRLPGDRQWHVHTEGEMHIANAESLETGNAVFVQRVPTTGGLLVKLAVRTNGAPLDEYSRELVAAVAERAASAADRLYAVMQRERVELALRRAEKLEAIGRLAGGVAHDFNNLLTVVVGNVEYIKSVLPPSRETDPFFAETLRATSRARDLIQHLLSFGRRRQLTRQPFEVGTVIQAVESLMTQHTSNAMRITTAIEAPAPVVTGDPAMLEQVLINVISNANEAISKSARRSLGELRIIASRTTLDTAMEDRMGTVLAPGRYVAIDLIDDGPGMSEEVRERAIDPFYTTKSVGEGSGLGLSSAYGLVAIMGGTLLLDDASPHGTWVRVLLPAS